MHEGDVRDNIAIERIWQDDGFFQIRVTCSVEIISASADVYVDDALIDELRDKLESITSLSEDEVFWESGERGDGSTTSISFTVSHEDGLGHVRIEAYMELEDGGSPSRHNCCFYVRTELGLLAEFSRRLTYIKEMRLGTRIELNRVG
ncbi:MAG TPA: hypothetical protein DEB24_03985 [Coriobacteriia bacterium]|nr:hypothetical protein [Coriobacteriia bacterium]